MWLAIVVKGKAHAVAYRCSVLSDPNALILRSRVSSDEEMPRGHHGDGQIDMTKRLGPIEDVIGEDIAVTADWTIPVSV
jgi:hypothetical protein